MKSRKRGLSRKKEKVILKRISLGKNKIISEFSYSPPPPIINGRPLRRNSFKGQRKAIILF